MPCLTPPLYLQVYFSTRLGDGGVKTCFWSKAAEKWAKPAQSESASLRFPGKQSVAGPDKPRTECDLKKGAYSASPAH